jgi:hypothetical protein
VGINLQLLAERGFGLWDFVHTAVFRSKLFVEAGLVGGKLDGGLIFGDRVHAPASALAWASTRWTRQEFWSTLNMRA